MRLDKPSPLIFLTQFKGCVRSVLGERAGLPRCPNLESAQEGKGGKEPEATTRLHHADGLH